MSYEKIHLRPLAIECPYDVVFFHCECPYVENPDPGRSGELSELISATWREVDDWVQGTLTDEGSYTRVPILGWFELRRVDDEDRTVGSDITVEPAVPHSYTTELVTPDNWCDDDIVNELATRWERDVDVTFKDSAAAHFKRHRRGTHQWLTQRRRTVGSGT